MKYFKFASLQFCIAFFFFFFFTQAWRNLELTKVTVVFRNCHFTVSQKCISKKDEEAGSKLQWRLAGFQNNAIFFFKGIDKAFVKVVV